jgi:hypothetical protein
MIFVLRVVGAAKIMPYGLDVIMLPTAPSRRHAA